MGLKLVRCLLAGIVLLIGVSGTAIGGECENVLDRMQDVLDKRKNGYPVAGSVPKSLQSLPRDLGVSIYESKNSPETIDINRKGIDQCFKLQGKWSQKPKKLVEIREAGHEKYPHIIAYVFFKNQKVNKIINELTVNSSLENEGGNRYIALIAQSLGETNIEAGSIYVKGIKKNIIWLDRKLGKPGFVEVVLCEGPCRDIPGFYNKMKITPTPDMTPQEPHAGSVSQDGIRDRKTKSVYLEPEISGERLKVIREEVRKEFESKSKMLGKDAIANFSASKTLFKFVDERNRKLGRKNLITKECQLRRLGQELTPNDIMRGFYNNCVSIPGYKIITTKPTIQSGKTPVLTFTLKKNKADVISKIEVPVVIADGSRITKECTLRAKIVNRKSGENIFEDIFYSTNHEPIKHTFSLKLDNPVPWKGHTLVLEKLEGADCQPEDGEFRIILTPEAITTNGVLKLHKTIELHSTLSKAPLMRKTIIGKKQAINSFNTDSGICTQSDLDTLMKAKQGYTYTIEEVNIRAEDGNNPPKTGIMLPAMVGVSCHASGQNGKYILINRKQEPRYCGWVPSDSLLKSKSNRPTGNIFTPQDKVCPDIAPLTVAEYCQNMEEMGESIEACDDTRISASTINAKFLVWNAALLNDQRSTSAMQVDIYRTLKASEKWRSLDIFSVLRIFDIARNDKGVFYLVGTDVRNMFGWVNQDSGTLWYTNLTTFFAKGGDGKIFSDPPWIDDALQIAEAPGNLDAMLKGGKAFSQYPVLFDRRIAPSDSPEGWSPFLEIAFIGRFCGEDQLCVESGEQTSSTLPDSLRKADVMFVIDATKSMKEYFGMVSKAVRNVITGVPDYRFGVAMYGDYLDKKKQGLNDNIQYRQEIPLRPLRRGNEFNGLANAKLYIEDPSGGYSQAPYAALAQTIRRTRWREDKTPKFIIHIADHGDRGDPPAELIDLMQKNTIFYMPIAVRGNYRKVENGDFVRQMQKILNAHVTPEGNIPIGLPEVLKTYTGPGKSDSGSEYDRIASAVRASVSLDPAIRKRILSELLGEEIDDAESSGQLLPDGFASLTDAIFDVYGISLPSTDDDQIQRILATKGFIQTAAIGDDEKNWTYSIALNPGDLRPLRESFADLCTNILKTSAAETFSDNLMVIIAKLTGDDISTAEEFKQYFSDRDSIPLSSQTVLGKGIMELGEALSDSNGGERVKALQKEACRTYTLLTQIEGKEKVDRPFEGKRTINGKEVTGDLVWNKEHRTYSVNNTKFHDWVATDRLGGRTIYIPLDYLPGTPDSIK